MPNVIQAPPGGGQYEFVQTFDARVGGSTTGAFTASTANLAIVRVAKPITLPTLRIYVGATGTGNVDVGVFQLIGANYTLLGSSGSTAVGATSTVQTLTLTTTVTLQPGIDYWLAMATDSATPVFYRATGIANVNAIGAQTISKASLFPLATFATAVTLNITPWIYGP